MSYADDAGFVGRGTYYRRQHQVYASSARKKNGDILEPRATRA